MQRHRRAEWPPRISNDAMKPLARVVAHFCDRLARLPDTTDRLFDVGRGTEFAELHTGAVEVHQHLLNFGDATRVARQGSVTRTQRSLHELQRAYRGMQGLLIGVPDRLLDLHPPTRQRTLRDLLQLTVLSYSVHLPEMPKTQQLLVEDSATPAKSLYRPPCPGSLSAMFERSERIHQLLIEALCETPDQVRSASAGRRANTQTRLDSLQWHLLKRQTELSALLKEIAHQRTPAMQMAHRIFSALGHAEGAMIGAEPQFENSWRPLIEFIGMHTSDLSRHG